MKFNIIFFLILSISPLTVFSFSPSCVNDLFPAKNYDLVDFTHLPPADKPYNIVAYVINHVVCPKGAQCIMPNSIIISENKAPGEDDKRRFISTDCPTWYEIGEEYIFSFNEKGVFVGASKN